MGSSIKVACQCLQQICLCQAFLGGYWAGMVGWPQSRANLAVTSVQGTLNLWGFWGYTQTETDNLRRLLFLFPLKEFGHPSSREQCQMSPVWSA